MRLLPARSLPILQFAVVVVLSGCTMQEAPISLSSDDYPYYFRQTKAPERIEKREILFLDLNGDGNFSGVSFASSDSNVVSVNQSGFISARGPGLATLRANCVGFSDSVSVRVDTTIFTGVRDLDPGGVPQTFELAQNYPNPFNPTTTIRFGLMQRSTLRIHVYNILRQEIRTLVDGVMEVGQHQIVWDGHNNFQNHVATGTYFYRLIATPLDGPSTGSGPPFVQTRKMILLR